MEKGKWTLIKAEWSDDGWEEEFHIDLSQVKPGQKLWDTGGPWYTMDAITIEDVGEGWVTIYAPSIGTCTLHPGEFAKPESEWQVAPYRDGCYRVNLIEGEYTEDWYKRK